MNLAATGVAVCSSPGANGSYVAFELVFDTTPNQGRAQGRCDVLRHHTERGFFMGSRRATPASRKIRANAAMEGTCGKPIACILSYTLIGPWSRPDASRAARTATACCLTSSVNFDGLDLGRRDLGSSTSACPSVFAR